MTGWFVFGGILLFLALLLFCPVVFQCGFETKLSATVRYLFFKIQLPPEKKAAKQRKEPAVPKETAEQKKKSKIRDIIKQTGLSGFLQILGETAKIAAGSAKRLFSHLVVSDFSIDITVSSEDAAQTAIRYGMVCGAVTTAVNTLFSVVKCKKQTVRISPDFQSGSSEVRFQMKARISLLFLLASLVYMLVKSARLYFMFKKSREIIKE